MTNDEIRESFESCFPVPEGIVYDPITDGYWTRSMSYDESNYDGKYRGWKAALEYSGVTNAKSANRNQASKCERKNKELQAHVERFRERLDLLRRQMIVFRCYTQDGQIAGICLEHEIDIRDLLKEIPAQSLAGLQAEAIEEAAEKCKWWRDPVTCFVSDLQKYAQELRNRGTGNE